MTRRNSKECPLAAQPTGTLRRRASLERSPLEQRAAYSRWPGSLVHKYRAVEALSGAGGQRFRLLTEAEWAYAARENMRSGTNRGDFESLTEAGAILDQFAWHGENSDLRSHSVEELKASAFGLYDTLGGCRHSHRQPLQAHAQRAARHARRLGHPLIPPRPIAFACTAAHKRRVRSSSRGRMASNLTVTRSAWRCIADSGECEHAGHGVKSHT